MRFFAANKNRRAPVFVFSGKESARRVEAEIWVSSFPARTAIFRKHKQIYRRREVSPLPHDSVGILLGSPVIHKILSGKPTYERAELYFECGHRIGLTPVLFNLEGLDLTKEQVSGYVWSPTSKRYLRTVQPLPRVIHKRILSSSPKLASLFRKLGKRLFNPPINRNKLRIHALLRQNARLKPHLPETRGGNHWDAVPKMFQRHPVIFIKPVVGSLGHSILKIEATGDGRYLLQSHRGKNQSLSEDQLKRFLSKLFSSQRDFFLQQGISLAKYRGSPFDLRVSVQKGAEGRWEISGAVAKVAPRKGILTNLSQNGRAVPARFPAEIPRIFWKKFTISLWRSAKPWRNPIPVSPMPGWISALIKGESPGLSR